MKVAELVAWLQTQPQDIEVAIEMYSEQVLLKVDQIEIFEGCAPRPDGWIQNKRPDMPTQQYLIFPGN